MPRLMSQKNFGAYPLDRDGQNTNAKYITDLFERSGPTLTFCDFFIHEGVAAEYMAKELNMEVYGSEIQEEFAREAQRRFGAGRVAWSDAYEMSVTNGMFDVVYLNPPYDIDKTADPSLSRREEFMAMKMAFPKIQPNGMMILVMYAHNFDKAMYKGIMKRFSQFVVYRLPKKDFGKYTQIVIVARRDENFIPMTDQEIEEEVPNVLEYMADEDNIDDIRYRAWHDGKKMKLPRPINKKNVNFGPKRRDWQSTLDIVSSCDMSILENLYKPPPKEPKPKMINELSQTQLPLLIVSNILTGVPILRYGKKALLRGSTIKRTSRKEFIETDDEGDMQQKRIELDHHMSMITILYENGEMEEILDRKEINELIFQYVNELLHEVYERVDIVFDKVIHRFWGESYDHHKYKFEGKHRLYNGQEMMVTAGTEFVADPRHPMLIMAAEMRSGKTPMSLYIMLNLIRLGRLQEEVRKESHEQPISKRPYLELLTQIRDRVDPSKTVKPTELDGIKPGEAIIVVTPTNIPLQWYEHIAKMYPGCVVRRLNNVDHVSEFFKSQEENPETIHVGVITFNEAKFHEGWESAYVTRMEYSKEQYVEDGERKERVKSTPRYYCPSTGQMLTYGPYNRPMELRHLDNKNRNNVPQRWTEGNIFNGYVEDVNHENRVYMKKDFKTIDRSERPFALWQYVRKYGLPKVGNGRVNYLEEKVPIKSQTKIHTVYGKNLKVVKQYPVTTSEKMISRRRVPNATEAKTLPGFNNFNLIPDEPILDNWVAKNGIRIMESPPGRRDINKILREKGLSEYTIGQGDEELDIKLTLAGLTKYSTEKGKARPKNPKYPLAEFISKKYANKVGLLIIDEYHAAASPDSGQGVAIRKLRYACRKTIALTGTLYGGISSSVYTLLFAANPIVRERFPWPKTKSPDHWVSELGYIKRTYSRKVESRAGNLIAKNDYTQDGDSQEAPGWHPMLFMYMAGCTIFANVRDIADGVPPVIDVPKIVPIDPLTLSWYTSNYNALQNYNSKIIQGGDFSFVGRYYNEAFHLADNAWLPDRDVMHDIYSSDDKTKKKREPLVSKKVVTIATLGEDHITAKEQMLADLTKEALNWYQDKNNGERCNVIIFIAQTKKVGIHERILNILERLVPDAVPFVMDTNTPRKSDQRMMWVKERMKNDGMNTLITNPALVEVGVDLSQFSRIIFYEVQSKFRGVLQAAKRTYGPGQVRNKGSDVIYLSNEDIFQRDLLQRISGKTVSNAVITGGEGGRHAEITDEVDDLGGIRAIIQAGKEGEIGKNLKSLEEIKKEFEQAMYTASDITQSPWYTENKRIKEEYYGKI